MSQSAIEPRLDKRQFAPGREIFKQGDDGDCAYLVESGRVAIYQTVGEQRIELGTVTHGELFGEMAAIDGGKRMASAVAIEQTTATRIPAELFERKLKDADKFIRGILKFFIRNIRSNHRGFVRRPRSINDQVRMLDFVSGNLRAFAERSAGDPAAAELMDRLAELESAIARVHEAAKRCHDTRHDLISELGPDDSRAEP